ncbi:NAD(P)H-hydrate dehydratase [Flavobacterium salilacus subsp. salilacus]|uniref:NAD(P)H-hydrate dehydratase n=1 Tax=Flavobacterium TaxID=237 RepID=UPI001074C66F|nr:MULTISPECIES: NAD(P)H-hydrate dehydratase [Flavobacterium]KAF2519212.1 NAD(P)H-hydrate dehydratase [Flavobacterium salilacus subsp. salilacus]MBE1613392.1 NAD(P)H-hydrate dehydratase [Flavobacterium sp. SaA2.13]
MKIFGAAEVRKADELTLHNQQITSTDLMERAATQAYLWLKIKFPDKETLFHVFCGQGNNGGDGLVIARLLKQDNYHVVLDIIESAGKPSADFSINLDKAKEAGITNNHKKEYQYTKGELVIIDAIFGIGLTREPDDAVKTTINEINNNSSATVVSIDVPSGMFLDRKTEIAVQADYLLTFQFPKLAFYLPDNYKYCTIIEILDIGLDKQFLKDTPSDYYLTDRAEAIKRFKPLLPYAHKGTQGHALIIGGSYGKIGAACLSAKAALKTGCGLVTAYIPECGYNIMQTYLPEAMVLTEGEKHLHNINFDIKPNAVGIGMGVGQHPETQTALYNFLKNNTAPLVIDADALNILSANKEWLKLLPENTILTPHPKELERLMGSWENDFDKLEKLKLFSIQHKVIVVAKDARTLVVQGDKVCINASGNAALATGGSGDVLAGIITSLVAQGYAPVDAAVFGVYLHGLTADIAVKEISAQTFTASDIVEYLSKAYNNIAAEY